MKGGLLTAGMCYALACMASSVQQLPSPAASDPFSRYLPPRRMLALQADST